MRVGRFVAGLFLPAEALRVAAVELFPAAVVRDALRGELAADVFAVFPRLEVLVDVAPRVALAARFEPFDLDRAVAVRDEVDRDVERGEALVFFAPLREDALPRPPAVVDLVAFFAVVVFFAALLRLVEARPALELFLLVEPARDDPLPDVDFARLVLVREELELPRDDDDPPFLPAAAFFDEALFELLPEDLAEPVLFLEPPLL